MGQFIAKVNIPPSSQIIDQRPKGLFLANVADKVGHAPQIENQIIVQYLKDLAENTYQTGKKVEKLFSIGAYSINRIAIHVAIDDEEKIWNGTQYGINFFSDVEKYFELIKPTGHKVYKWMNIVNSLAVFKRNALKVAEQVRLELIHSKEIIRGLNKKKIISQTDLMNLESIEVLAEIVSASWAEKDKSKIIIH
ncbi:35576_t:CDS:2 [Gigaspora margarita]|uniref:35576_t:CDS:1 n=1 Tax=Gigaspora margarita TaxID=4874 RepID=A0ABN7WJY9_GIGMA|nr:35576_t:CDS:2 [Gigaspora margarita]